MTKLLILFVFLFGANLFAGKVLKDKDHYYITQEGANWMLSFPLSDFILADKYSSDVSSNYIFSDKIKKYMVAVEINQNTDCSDPSSCCEYFLKNPSGTPFLKVAEKVTKYEIGEAAVAEYFVPVFEEQEINQNNLSAVYFKPGYMIIIHISKPNYQDSDHKTMEDFIKSVAFIENKK